ncbi:transcriptional regulator, XRE family [Roseovarius pacificus]|uniref:Transcriptional regulator, XRE family n=1 Tax=Roseovarius pacificus TaxID=337701 RepID=A0A1M7ERU6_9RHOB|nr:helix-turn-helix transcriptional regulator [Roseovarius pacificus]GGO57548.1 transcriptional regulator [Roseovarius pacificus]SHL94348.1 transcriptional regulator, XRE family [Roseovarius pacificus]
MKSPENHIGYQLKQWRKRRRLSQLALALDANISQRHLSFLESGRSRPSREMVLQLTRQLDVPLRERNVMLHTAGYAPVFPQRPLDAPELSAAREAIDRILHGHLPHPALAVDRHWTMLSANAAVSHLLADVSPHLLEGDVNVLRLSLHPEGLASRILNLLEWREHVLTRLSHEIEHSADPVLAALRDELEALPHPAAARTDHPVRGNVQAVAVPFRLKTDLGSLSFLTTTTVFGTAVDVTLSEVTIEAFFPADKDTANAMAELDKGA